MITLIGVRLAKQGLEFLNYGPTSECAGCRLYKVCMGNLEPQRRYKIVEVMNKLHPCRLHDDGVQLIEVEEAPIQTKADPKQAIEGSVISFKPSPCDKFDCDLWDVCNPEGLSLGDKCKVVGISEGDPAKCPAGLSLKDISLQRVTG